MGFFFHLLLLYALSARSLSFVSLSLSLSLSLFFSSSFSLSLSLSLSLSPHLSLSLSEKNNPYLAAAPYIVSEISISYAETDLAIVPAAAPTRKNQRATSWPAPISAKTPYQSGLRLTDRAFSAVLAKRSPDCSLSLPAWWFVGVVWSGGGGGGGGGAGGGGGGGGEERSEEVFEVEGNGKFRDSGGGKGDGSSCSSLSRSLRSVSLEFSREERRAVRGEISHRAKR